MTAIEAREHLSGPRDPGLQGERTALAWSRTGMAVLANALLVLRSGMSNERASIEALGVLLLIAAAALFAFGGWRRRRLVRAEGDIAPPAIATRLTAIVTVVACAAGIASILS